MNEGRVSDLQRLNALLKRVGKQDGLRKSWVAHLRARGADILREEQIAKKSFRIVEDLLEFKKKQEELLARVFIEREDLDLFKMGLKESLEQFLNKDPN